MGKRFSAGLLLISVAFLAGCGGGTDPVSNDPVVEVFSINDDMPYTLSTDVTLTIEISDVNGTDGMRMMISDDESFTGAGWQVYQTSISHVFTAGDGPRTLYIKAINKDGAESDRESDSIVLAVNTAVAYFDPCPLDLDIDDGGKGTVRLMIANATDLVSGRFEIMFNEDKLEVTGLDVDVATGHFLEDTGASLIVSDREYDNEEGTILIGALGAASGFTGVDGGGIFAEIEFMAREDITAALPLMFLGCEVYCYPVSNPPVALDEIFMVDGRVE